MGACRYIKGRTNKKVSEKADGDPKVKTNQEESREEHKIKGFHKSWLPCPRRTPHATTASGHLVLGALPGVACALASWSLTTVVGVLVVGASGAFGGVFTAAVMQRHHDPAP